MSHDDYGESDEEDEEDRGPTPDEEVEKINGHAEKEHKDDEDDPAFVEEGETMKPRTEYKDDKDFRDSVGDGETMRPRKKMEFTIESYCQLNFSFTDVNI